MTITDVENILIDAFFVKQTNLAIKSRLTLLKKLLNIKSYNL